MNNRDMTCKIKRQFIFCPTCNKLQLGEVIYGEPFNIKLHTCNHCGYSIREREWTTIWSRLLNWLKGGK